MKTQISRKPNPAEKLAASGARWLWPASLDDGPNQYIEFSQSFQSPSALKSAELVIAADSEYAAWLNGEFLGCGQFPDVPPQRTCDLVKITGKVRKGRNELRIVLHYQGHNTSQYIKGEPGVVFAVIGGSIDAVSAAKTKWRVSPNFRQGGDVARITGQLGFTYEYDARNNAGWNVIKTADYHVKAEKLDLVARPIPKLDIGGRVPVKLVAQGALGPLPTETGGVSIASIMQCEPLMARRMKEMFGGETDVNFPSESGVALGADYLNSDGIYLIFDMQREEAGFIEFELEADAGVIVDVANGEHLDDMRVRSHVGGRNFANRYICAGGRQTYTHYLQRMAGRYVQINVRNIGADFKIFYAGMRPSPYPIEERGSLKSGYALQDRIYETGVRTLRLCMHEHYEDCPWREQALYANDSRNQALSGYYAFGDVRFPATALGLYTKGLGGDGWLEMCMPAQIAITIPSFTLAWILAVADHRMYTGNLAFSRKALPTVRGILEAREKEMVDGLLPCPAGERYWQFYDWADGLSGSGRIKPDEVRYDAPLNMLLSLAFKAGSLIAQACGAEKDARKWANISTEILPKIHREFWDTAAEAYLTYVGDRAPKHYCELSQSLAILCGAVAKAETRDHLRDGLMTRREDWVETTLSQSLYKYEAVLSGGTKFGRRVFDSIDSEWGAMLEKGATSFWEMREGAEAFSQAGSLCHGWSAIPVYFYGAYVLGVRPVEPGFKKFIVAPMPCALDSAKGTVPTPHGPIHVEWTRKGNRIRLRIQHPSSCHRVRRPSESKQFAL